MTHADKARRIAPPESYGTLCNEIATALAAAERRGIERAAQKVYAILCDSNLYGMSLTIISELRALLPESSGFSGELPAEPAAKCATCGITHPANHSCTPAVDR